MYYYWVVRETNSRIYSTLIVASSAYLSPVSHVHCTFLNIWITTDVILHYKFASIVSSWLQSVGNIAGECSKYLSLISNPITREQPVLPTCHTDTGSGPPPLNGLMFQPAVGQQSEVVLFLLLVQRCGTACQAMWHQLRLWQRSRTGSRRTCSAAATKLFHSIHGSCVNVYVGLLNC